MPNNIIFKVWHHIPKPWMSLINCLVRKEQRTGRSSNWGGVKVWKSKVGTSQSERGNVRIMSETCQEMGKPVRARLKCLMRNHHCFTNCVNYGRHRYSVVHDGQSLKLSCSIWADVSSVGECCDFHKVMAFLMSMWALHTNTTLQLPFSRKTTHAARPRNFV